MVPSLTTILQRLTGEWAALLQPEAILTVCREIGYTAWRDRVLTLVTTMQVFLLQILHGNTDCSHVPHLSGLRFSAAAYCQPARDCRCASLPSSWSASRPRCSPPSRVNGGGMAIAPFSLMVREAPCPILLLYRTPSASRQSSGLGVAFPSPGSWGWSIPAPVCS
jgi:hypothetical protein